VDLQLPARLAAERTDPPTPAQADRHHDPLRAEGHVDDGRPGQEQQPLECRGDAHVALPRKPLVITNRQPAEGGGASLTTCASSARSRPRRTSRKRKPNAAFRVAASPPNREETRISTTTTWDAVQVAYFTSVATWHYLTAPFVFTYAGVTAKEIEPWDEHGATWRRLAVTFPPGIANHTPDQVFYYDEHFMLRRLDYSPSSPATRAWCTTPPTRPCSMRSCSRPAGGSTGRRSGPCRPELCPDHAGHRTHDGVPQPPTEGMMSSTEVGSNHTRNSQSADDRHEARGRAGPSTDIDRAKRLYKTLGYSDTPAPGRATDGMPAHGREPRARSISSSSPESALRAIRSSARHDVVGAQRHLHAAYVPRAVWSSAAWTLSPFSIASSTVKR
jgi:hypothetical protein